MRRATIAIALAAVTALPGLARADEERRLPVNDPGVFGQVAAVNDCTSDSEFDQPSYYGDDCRRLKIVFGPIVVQPGKNDVLIQPVTVEKPFWDGYMVRFKPGLIDATGTTPPVENLHLHHGTWLNAYPSYGSGPWLATGEEKTIVAWPFRYGLKVTKSDTWLFLHMVHSAVATPTVVYATYDIDFVPSAVAEATQADGKPLMKGTKGIWLDVGGGAAWGNNTGPNTSNDDPFTANPVYNVQKGFGTPHAAESQEFSVSPEDADMYGLDDTRLNLCSWPDDNCARENSSGNVSRNQGNDISDDVLGSDWTASAAFDGSLVVMGGHLHMGGTNDTVSLVRTFTGPNGETRRFEKVIHVSDAYYWNWADPTRVGAPPISWDVSMTGVSADFGWKVRIKQGDRLRLNADYETDLGSWYENMGIVMTWVAPGDTTGLDPFRGCTWNGSSSELSGCEVEINDGFIADRNSTGPVSPDEVYDMDTLEPILPRLVNRPEAAPGYTLPGAQFGACAPSDTVLCTRGQITHPHISTSGNHDGCVADTCSDSLLNAAKTVEWLGGDVDTINMSGFLYAPGDFTQIAATGIPQVRLGETIQFINEDGPAYIPHTATACAAPCSGPVSTHYPIADGGKPVVKTPSTSDDPDFIVVDESGTAALDTMDFDTTQLGLNVGATRNLTYDLKATRTGVFTYFCRIHPFMRGAFEVYDPAVL